MISCEMKVPAHQTTAHVDLLGSFSLQCGGAVQPSIPIKGQAIVAFLAIQQGLPVARDVVAELFWPDRGDKQARNSLKQELMYCASTGWADLISLSLGTPGSASRRNALLAICTGCERRYDRTRGFHGG